MSSFSSNQIVWAKVKGYPWWPAMILKVQSLRGRHSPKEILVNFIGDNSHATVEEDKVADFDERFKQYSVVKNKKLQDGIKAALRIQKGESTFEEERVKFDSKKRKPSCGSETVESMCEDRSFEDEIKFQSPKASKGKRSLQDSGLKQKEKEKEKIEEPQMMCDSFLDFIPNRVTRAQSKDQHIEVRADAFLFLAKKPSVHGRGKKKAEGLSEMQEESESHSVKRKASTEISLSEQHPNEHLENENENAMLSPKINETSPSNTMKTAASDGSQSEISKKNEVKKVVEAKGNPRKRIVLEKGHEESPQENMNKEGKFSEARETVNRSSSSNMDCMGALLCARPRKIDFSEDRRRKGYEMGSLVQFENEFEHYLNKFINRFKQKEVLERTDQDIEELLKTIDEFKKVELQGTSLINSKIGKILKTMDYVFAKNRHRINGKENCVTSELGNVIRKIKENILKFCLDNTGYMEALKLNSESEGDKKGTTRMEIETVETTQQLENNTPKCTKSSLFIETFSPVTTKIDDTPKSLKDFTSPNFASLFGGLKEMPNFSLNSARKLSTDSMTSKTEQQAADRALRKKVCARIIRAMQDNYKMEKEKAQEIILKIEGKIHEFNSHSFDNYKQAMLNFYKLIKTHDLNINDVNEIKEMSGVVFNNLLEQSALPQFSLLGNKGISAEVLESPSLKNFRLDLNLMEKFDHVSNEYRKEGLSSFISSKQPNQSPLLRATK